MVEPASTATPANTDYENWDYLGLLIERKQSMLDDIRKIHESCPRDPGHVTKGVKECKPCWRKIVDRIKQRYLENPKGEWYADRPIFIQHLTDLIGLVRRGEKNLDDIENRVMDEKRKWFREGVKRWAATLATFGLTEKREELLRLHDDQKLEFKDFCEKVQKVIDVDMEACPPGSLERLFNTRNKKTDRAKVYMDIIFFPNGKPDVVPKPTQKYIDMLEQGNSMKKILDTMTEDRRHDLDRQVALEKKKQALERLRSAMREFEKQREKKIAKREKAAKVAAEAAAASLAASQGPPCAVCKLPSGKDDGTALLCSICEISSRYRITTESYQWCSQKCQKEDFANHCDKRHSTCAAGKDCIQLREDVDLDDLLIHLCKFCLGGGKSAAFWCCLNCATANYVSHRTQAHRDEVHRMAWLKKPRADNAAEAFVTADQIMIDIGKMSTAWSDLSQESAMYSRAERDKVQAGLESSDAMEGVEMQGVSSTGAPVREPVADAPTASSSNGNHQDKETTDIGRTESVNSDVAMRDAGASHDQPKDDVVYRWGDKAPRHKIDPATYKPKQVESLQRQPNEPLLSREMEDRYLNNRRSAEPPVEPTSIFSKTGSNGTIQERSTSLEAAAAAGNQRSQLVPPKATENGRTALPTSSSAGAKDPPRKFPSSTETQPPSRYRNDDQQRRYGGDRDYSRGGEDFRKRPAPAAEARHLDRDNNRDYKRARSENSEEKEEGEI